MSIPLSRRTFLQTAGALALPLVGCGLTRSTGQAPGSRLLYVGTYTGDRSEGIYVYKLNLLTGALERVGATGGVVNPSYLTLDGQKRHLYAVSEGGQGEVVAYAIDPATGGLSELNRVSSHGSAPCYVSLAPGGGSVLVANYSSGTAAVLPVGADGRLGEATSVVQHSGSGADPGRQEGPHAHFIRPDPTGRRVLVCDLGIDRVMVYDLDRNAGKLTPNAPPSIPLAPGAGPRHLAFDPTGRFLYVINELNSTVTGFAYDGRTGAATAIQTISTLPAGFSGTSFCADIHLAPSGRFLYGSNRGHDSIVIFAVDPKTGGLSLVGHESTRGSFPRNFTLDPSGTLLLVANQKSDSVATFRVDPARGTLTPLGDLTAIPAPVCLAFG